MLAINCQTQLAACKIVLSEDVVSSYRGFRASAVGVFPDPFFLYMSLSHERLVSGSAVQNASTYRKGWWALVSALLRESRSRNFEWVCVGIFCHQLFDPSTETWEHLFVSSSGGLLLLRRHGVLLGR